jgi:hypothetical protein
MIAAYALAMQALLGAVAIGQAAGAGDAFVICHTGADGQPADNNPQAAHDCQLCTLTHAAFALPGDAPAGVAYAFVVVTTTIAPRAIDRIAFYDSPTGQYQRGPPGVIAG